MRLMLLSVTGMVNLPLQTFASPGGKLSKKAAEYQDVPKGIQMCATCTLYDAPHSCKVVEDEISPNGWCKAYAMTD